LSTSLRNRAPLAGLGLLLLGFLLGAFWIPEAKGDPAFRLFYLHVPIALTAYACFGFGAWKAFRLLATGNARYDLESYTAIHMGVIFGLLTLATGSIWAKYTWGTWWSWGERQLVLFLILFLFYSAYFMLRYSTEPGPRRERNSAVYALFGVTLIPVSFLAIRIAGTILHPTVFTHEGPQMSWQIFCIFLTCLVGMLALAATLYRVELGGKRVDARLRELRELLA
jgi:heme exporter protein C